MQQVQLDKHVKLLDSPGIVVAQGGSNASTVLKNCVKVCEDTETMFVRNCFCIDLF